MIFHFVIVLIYHQSKHIMNHQTEFYFQGLNIYHILLYYQYYILFLAYYHLFNYSTKKEYYYSSLQVPPLSVKYFCTFLTLVSILAKPVISFKYTCICLSQLGQLKYESLPIVITYLLFLIEQFNSTDLPLEFSF